MSVLLNRSPFFDDSSLVSFGNERILVRGNQVIAWISLTIRRVTEPNPISVPFPAIVDTGFSHSFAINERHLIAWAGMRPETMDILSTVRDRGQRIQLRAANIWCHCNQRRVRDQLTTHSPIGLAAPKGIAVYPDGDFPRLPILGLRVIAENDLILKVDGPRREATLRTGRGWWGFG